MFVRVVNCLCRLPNIAVKAILNNYFVNVTENILTTDLPGNTDLSNVINKKIRN